MQGCLFDVVALFFVLACSALVISVYSQMADEDYEANKAAIEALCREPANSECSDCGAQGTRWASVNHGVFFCIRCSGFHRGLGATITKVKSTNLDKWTEAEVEVMRRLGNRAAKGVFEAKLGRGAKPNADSDDHTMRTFITQKYQEKKFAAGDWVSTLKKIFKGAGYKAGRKALKDAGYGDEEEEAPKKEKKEKKDKKDKKDKKEDDTADAVQTGFFGAVSVAADAREARRVELIQLFDLAAFGFEAAPVAE
jgi:hypothetical protein